MTTQELHAAIIFAQQRFTTQHGKEPTHLVIRWAQFMDMLNNLGLLQDTRVELRFRQSNYQFMNMTVLFSDNSTLPHVGILLPCDHTIVPG